MSRPITSYVHNDDLTFTKINRSSTVKWKATATMTICGETQETGWVYYTKELVGYGKTQKDAMIDLLWAVNTRTKKVAEGHFNAKTGNFEVA